MGDLSRISRTSRTMFFSYKPLFPAILLSHVIKGEEAEALEMIDKNPPLLLNLSNAIDHSGRP